MDLHDKDRTENIWKQHKIHFTIQKMREIWAQMVASPLFVHDEHKIRDFMRQGVFHSESVDIDKKLMDMAALTPSEVSRLCDRQVFIFRAAVKDGIEKVMAEKNKTR